MKNRLSLKTRIVFAEATKDIDLVAAKAGDAVIAVRMPKRDEHSPYVWSMVNTRTAAHSLVTSSWLKHGDWKVTHQLEKI